MSAAAYQSLDPDQIVHTIEALSRRIDERFPDAGLGRVCRALLDIARRAKERAAWIGRPIVPLRVGAVGLVAIIAAGLLLTLARLRPPAAGFEIGQFIQVLEAGDARDADQAPARAEGVARAAFHRAHHRRAPAHQGP